MPEYSVYHHTIASRSSTTSQVYDYEDHGYINVTKTNTWYRSTKPKYFHSFKDAQNYAHRICESIQDEHEEKVYIEEDDRRCIEGELQGRKAYLNKRSIRCLLLQVFEPEFYNSQSYQNHLAGTKSRLKTFLKTLFQFLP